MKKTIAAMMAMIMMVSVGCGNDTDNDKSSEISSNSAEYQYLEYNNFSDKLNCFALKDDGNYYAVIPEEGLAEYSNDGKLIKKFDDTESLRNISYFDGFIYGINIDNGCLISVDTETNEVASVCSSLQTSMINNLVATDNGIYLVAVPANESNNELDYQIDENNYINFGEKIIRVDIDSGETYELEIDHPIAIYYSSDGVMYVYTYQNKEYQLNKLDLKTQKLTLVSDMTDVGYIFSFIYENDKMIYANFEMIIKEKDLSSGESKTLEKNAFITYGGSLQYSKGNIVRLKSIFDENNNASSELKNVSISPQSGKLLISSDFQTFDYDKLSELSGITAEQTENNYLWDEMALKLMAGDSDVDIFCIDSYMIKAIAQKGAYVPLNSSKKIIDHLDSCFDYVKDSAVNADGDIMFMPLVSGTKILFCSETNMQKFDFESDDLAYFDDFYETMQTLYEKKQDKKMYGFAYSLFLEMQAQYDLLYNDFDEKFVNYDTDTYKYLYELMLSGWRKNTPDSSFKYLDNQSAEKYPGLFTYEYPCYNPEIVLFKISGLYRLDNLSNAPGKTGHELDGWCLLPMPRLNEKIDKNTISVKYALVNPNSNNIDMSISLLETVASNPKECLFKWSMLKKDKSYYSDIFDINSKQFEQLYNIFDNGRIVTNNIESSRTDIDEYQSGRVTLDEAIAMYQREVEMWLNE